MTSTRQLNSCQMERSLIHVVLKLPLEPTKSEVDNL